MTIRPRIAIAALLLAALAFAGVTYWQQEQRLALIGLTDKSCDGGKSITGSDYDDWGALCFYQAQNAELMASGIRPDVVMIGDSITLGWPDQGKTTINRGIGRQTSSQILLRFMQDAVRLHPRTVHILVGTNDIAGNTGPVTLQQLEDNVRAMIGLAEGDGMAVVLGTVPPVDRFEEGWPGDPRPRVAKVNAMLQRIADERERVTLADYHAVLANTDGTPKAGLLVDGVHPGPAGYAAMQAVFLKAMREAASETD